MSCPKPYHVPRRVHFGYSKAQIRAQSNGGAFLHELCTHCSRISPYQTECHVKNLSFKFRCATYNIFMIYLVHSSCTSIVLPLSQHDCPTPGVLYPRQTFWDIKLRGVGQSFWDGGSMC